MKMNHRSPNCFFTQFRIYVGLLQQTPAPPKDSAPDADAKSDDPGSDSDSEDADVALAAVDDETNLMEAFLSDPEFSMKIFFSSHFRERGLIWYMSTSLIMIPVILIHYPNSIQVRTTLRCHADLGVLLPALPHPQPRLP
jgi:hypothetical protein